MAKVLRQKRKDLNYSMLLGGKGTGDPIFFIPSRSRNPLVFSELASKLDADRPCYGLELPSPDNGVESFNSLEDLAEHCVREIRSIQPNGPYTLAGYSFGGILALEIARQLYELDPKVSKIFMFDAPHPKALEYTDLGFSRSQWILKMLREEKHRYLSFIVRNQLMINVFWRFGLLKGKSANAFRMPDVYLEDVPFIDTEPLVDKYEIRPFPVDLVIFTVRETRYTRLGNRELTLWKSASERPTQYCLVPTDYHLRMMDKEYVDDIRADMLANLGSNNT